VHTRSHARRTHSFGRQNDCVKRDTGPLRDTGPQWDTAPQRDTVPQWDTVLCGILRRCVTPCSRMLCRAARMRQLFGRPVCVLRYAALSAVFASSPYMKAQAALANYNMRECVRRRPLCRRALPHTRHWPRLSAHFTNSAHYHLRLPHRRSLGLAPPAARPAARHAHFSAASGRRAALFVSAADCRLADAAVTLSTRAAGAVRYDKAQAIFETLLLSDPHR
jgi:hypothetical protein